MPLVDSEHRGPLVNVAGFVMLISMVLFAACKVTTKWLMVRKLQNDDILMILASLTAIGECVAVSYQVQSGLGQPEENLTLQQFDLYQKAVYVSQMFYVLPVFLAKLATLQFLTVLAGPNEPNPKRMAMRCSFYVIIIWLVVAIVCILFQCNVPRPWNQASGRCFGRMAFWTVNGAIDALSQILISFAPVYLLFNLQVPSSNKRVAMASFTPNLTTIPLAVLRLVYLFKADRSSDLTFASFNAALVTVIHANYSIIASSMPFLKPMVDSLVVGLMTNDIQMPVDSEGSNRKQDSFNPFAILGGRLFTSRTGYGGSRSQSSGHTATATAVKGNDMDLANLERYGSQERMVIAQTKTVDVDSKSKKLQPSF